MTQEIKKTKRERARDYLRSIPKRYFITAFSGMAIGLFCTLIAGTIIQTLASIFKSWAYPIYEFLFATGNAAQFMMGAGIGAGIAYTLKADKMVIMSALAAGFLGAHANTFMSLTLLRAGNPINAYLCALVATELGLLVSGKTKLDILVVPLTCLISAGIIAVTLGKPVDSLILSIGNGIKWAMERQTFLMSVIISASMGILLTLPTSSAAIGVSASLSGLAAGAAVAGCCCHMVGFAVMSFRENRFKGLVSQGLGTSMLQIPNIAKKPILLVPPIIASIISGPIMVLVFSLECNPAGSGMGTAGLVGVIETIKVSLDSGISIFKIIFGILICCFIIPSVVCLLLSELMRKKEIIKFNDLRLE